LIAHTTYEIDKIKAIYLVFELRLFKLKHSIITS